MGARFSTSMCTRVGKSWNKPSVSFDSSHLSSVRIGFSGMARRLATESQLALEITQEQISKDDVAGRRQDAELREVEAFLINLLEAFVT